MMEDEDDSEVVAWKNPIHRDAYVQEEGYKPFQKWWYAGNKDTS